MPTVGSLILIETQGTLVPATLKAIHLGEGYVVATLKRGRSRKGARVTVPLSQVINPFRMR